MRPGRQPPPGVMPNFENPENGNADAIALLVVCVVLAATMGLVRLYSRLVVVKSFKLEDCRQSTTVFHSTY